MCELDSWVGSASLGDKDQPWVEGDATASPLGPPPASLTLGKARLSCPAWRPTSPLSQRLPPLRWPPWLGSTELYHDPWRVPRPFLEHANKTNLSSFVAHLSAKPKGPYLLTPAPKPGEGGQRILATP